MLNTSILDPKPSWLLEPEFQQILMTLNARLVGGSVRETLLGHKPNDFDIATPFKPEEVTDLLQEKGFRTIPTGMKHGTITAIGKKYHYEVTTLRQDIETFGRHAIVNYTDSWEEDALRRDFTYNALYCDHQGIIYDYTDGLKDLETKFLRFIGDPQKRIQEDYLRILRYFRFLSQYDGLLHKESYDAACYFSIHLKELSGERLSTEIFKLLNNPYALKSLQLMEKGNVFKNLMPYDINLKLVTKLYNSDFKLPSVDIKFFLLTFPQNNDEIKLLKKTFRLSNKTEHYLKCLIKKIGKTPMSAAHSFYHFLYAHDKAITRDWLMLQLLLELIDVETYQQFLIFCDHWTKQIMPIKASDLKDRGFKDGPFLGIALQIILNAWIESGFTLTKEECYKIII
ncbi:MAG: CCA tRNA nucleotidyltransferase [Alphaproteobacteria bacterium]|nr:CCA tRNA nucleotidyltransferase [Alphaproteobacteria bacterium]